MESIAPILPGHPRNLTLNNGLKETTQALLEGHAYRYRARVHAAFPYEITPYSLAQDGPDYLFYLYWSVRKLGEHAALWGEAGLSPTRFLAAFASVPIVVAHEQGAAWREGMGNLLVVWGDDVVPELRLRLHFWMAPMCRHPKLSVPIGRAMLSYFFDVASYQLLEGRTPATDTLALRFIRRLGFTLLPALPHAEWVYDVTGERRPGAVIPSMLTKEEWYERGRGRS